MSTALTQEQQLLDESLAHFVEREYGFARRSVIAAGEPGFSRELWRMFAELGWLGAGLPEAVGGIGGGPVEQAVIGRAFGRAMVLEPYLSTAVAGARALELASDRGAADALLTRLAAGELLLAVAYAEREARFDLHHQSTRARAAGNAFSLDGHKLAVLDAPSADKLVVSARLSGEMRAADGVGLFLVDARAPGLRLDAFRTMDGGRAAHVALDGCPAELLVGPEAGLDVLEQVVERAISVRCAQAVGAMQAAFGQTVDYLRTREQFGQPLAAFQVLQHRLVDLQIAARECLSMSMMVAEALAGADRAEQRRSVAAAKAFVGKRANRVAQEIVQMHGGIGMTEEYAAGHYFRYLTQFCSSFGSAAHHLHRYVALSRR